MKSSPTLIKQVWSYVMQRFCLKLQTRCALIQVLCSFTLVQSINQTQLTGDQLVCVSHFWSNLIIGFSCDSYLHRTVENTQKYWQTIESEVGLPSRSLSKSMYTFSHQLSIDLLLMNWTIMKSISLNWRTDFPCYLSPLTDVLCPLTVTHCYYIDGVLVPLLSILT